MARSRLLTPCERLWSQPLYTLTKVLVYHRGPFLVSRLELLSMKLRNWIRMKSGCHSWMRATKEEQTNRSCSIFFKNFFWRKALPSFSSPSRDMSTKGILIGIIESCAISKRCGWVVYNSDTWQQLHLFCRLPWCGWAQHSGNEQARTDVDIARELMNISPSRSRGRVVSPSPLHIGVNHGH